MALEYLTVPFYRLTPEMTELIKKIGSYDLEYVRFNDDKNRTWVRENVTG